VKQPIITGKSFWCELCPITNIGASFAVWHKRELYATDCINHQVVVYNSQSGDIRYFGKSFLKEPKGITIMTYWKPHWKPHDFNILVTDSGLNQVLVFNKNGERIASFGSKGCKNGEFNSPKGIITWNKLIYVADCLNHRVQIFSGCSSTSGEWGHWVGTFGKHGSANNQFCEPHDFGIFRNELYITDYSNHRVQIYTRAGDFIRTFKSPVELRFPVGIVFEYPYDRILISVSDGIVVLYDNEKLLYKYNNIAYGLAYDFYDGRVFTAICDACNGQVLS